MNVHIQINTKTFVRFWLVVIGFALVALAIYSARAALTIIGISLFLSLALSQPVNWLAKIFPSKSRVLCTAVAYLFVIVLLGLIVFLVIPPIVEQTIKFIQNVPNLIESASHQSVGVTRFIKYYHLQPEVDRVAASMKDSVAQFASGIGPIVISSIGSVLSFITSLILVLVLTFFMLVEGPTWVNRLWGMYKDQDKLAHHKSLAAKMYTVVTSYVTGQLTVSAIAGTVAGVTVFVLSMFTKTPTSLAVPTAAIVFIASLIPLFGAMLGALFVSLVLSLNAISAAFIFLALFIVYQQLEANFISPKIQSKRISLSPLAILISITIGIYMFGLAGGIVSIPIAGCIKVLIEDYLSRERKKPAVTVEKTVHVD
jgi:predicted PurR-regulated permease PerM